MSVHLFQVVILTSDLAAYRYDRAFLAPDGIILAIYTRLFGPAPLAEAQAYLARIRGLAPMSGGDADYWPWGHEGLPKILSDKTTRGSARDVKYTASADGGCISLKAEFTSPYGNLKTYIAHSALAIFPPQFILVVETPEIVTQVVTTYTTHPVHFCISNSPIQSVVVWDDDGRHEVPIPGALATE